MGEESRVHKLNVPVKKKKISSQMDEKRMKGLYYHCEEKWNLTRVKIQRFTFCKLRIVY